MNDIKVVILGNSGVGKTTILQSYNNQQFTPSESSTLGIDYVMIYKNNLKIKFFDTAGQERYFSLVDNYSRYADFVIIVFDPNEDDDERKETIQFWKKKVDECINLVKVFIISNNKTTLPQNRSEDDESILQNLILSENNNFDKVHFLYQMSYNAIKELNDIMEEIINTITKEYIKSNKDTHITIQLQEKSNKSSWFGMFSNVSYYFPKKRPSLFC